MFQYREPRGFTEEQARYLREMQAALAQELVRLFSGEYRHKPPENFFAGQVVAADGVNWNPGAGVGIYQRNEANTAWRFVG